MKKLSNINDNIFYTPERGLRQLALESEILTNVISTFRNTLPGLVDFVKSSTDTFFNVSEHGALSKDFFNTKEKKSSKILSEINYINFAETPVSVPEGFSGQMIEYVRDHYEMTELLYRNFNIFSSEFSAILSSFITNKDDRISSREHTELKKNVDKTTKSFYTYRNNFFKNDEGKSKTALINIIKRNQDFNTMFDYVRKIDQLQKKSSISKVQDQIKNLVSLLDIVISTVQDTSEKRVSPAAAKNIADTAFSLGEFGRIISINYNDSVILLTSAERIVDTVLNIEE